MDAIALQRVRPSKRLKSEADQRIPCNRTDFISEMLPEEILWKVTSFLDLQSVWELRRTSSLLRRAFEHEIFERIASDDDDDSDETASLGTNATCDMWGHAARIQVGWTEDFVSKESLVDLALAECRSCGGGAGDDPLDVYYNENTARALLRTKGRVAAKDFVPAYYFRRNPEARTRGWDAEVQYNPGICSIAAQSLVKDFFQNVERVGKNWWGLGGQQVVGEDIASVKKCLLWVLARASYANAGKRIANIRNSSYQFQIRYSKDQPLAGEQRRLQFLWKNRDGEDIKMELCLDSDFPCY